MIKNSIKVVMLFAMLSLVPHAFANTDNHGVSFNPNFSHTVYFWLKNPDSQSDKQEFERLLKQFVKQSSYGETRFIGTPPQSNRKVVDDTFSYSLVMSFSSLEEQQKYQNEDIHRTFLENVKDLIGKAIVYNSIPIE